MPPHTLTRPAELALPVASLAAMRDALVDAAGDDTAAYALRQAGYAAGDAFFRLIASSRDAADPGTAPADRYWTDLARLFASRGWGHITFARVHDGVGAIEATDWAEARAAIPADDEADGRDAETGQPPASGAQPACHFTTGMLANVLGQTAGTEVAVLEVECRARGDDRCRFLFGGSDAVYRVYDSIAAGARADAALAELR